MLRPLIRLASATALLLGLANSPLLAAGGGDNPDLNWEPHAYDWSFDGPFGQFDQASLQRGFMVYEQACMSCHTLRHVSYRNLEALGFSEDEVKGIARSHSQTYGDLMCGALLDDDGFPVDELIYDNCMNTFGRLTAASPFPDIYNTEERLEAAAETHGVVPPDLSLMAKARHGGPDYIRSLLTGYFETEDGDVLNHYYPGGRIAMSQPLVVDGQVEYPEGQPSPSVDQMAADVAHFLMWTAEPTLEDRKRIGARVMLFLVVFAAVMYAVKRRVWADLH